MADGGIKSLKFAAETAFGEGDWKVALARYTELEKVEPRDPNWSRRIGETLKKLGKKHDAEQVRAFARAADKYVQTGEMLKAIALCKAILQLDPEHYQTQARLAALHLEQSKTPTPTPIPPIGKSMTPIPAAHTPVPVVSGRPLEALDLPRALPPRRNSDALVWAPAGMREISLEEDAPRPIPRRASQEQSALRARTILPFTPLFSTLSQASLLALINRVRLVYLAQGATLFRQGDPGETMYVVAEGGVAIIAEGTPRVILARLNEGSFFGEIALITNQARSATVESVAESQLLEIDRGTVSALIDSEPGVLPALLRFVSRRVLDTVFQTNPIFRSVPADKRALLAQGFRFLEVASGGVLMKEGTPPTAMFVLVAGSLRAASAKEPSPRHIQGAGTVILEQAPVAGSTVWAETKCLILGLPKEQFSFSGR